MVCIGDRFSLNLGGWSWIIFYTISEKCISRNIFLWKRKIYLTFQNILYSIRIISVLVRVYSIIFEANAKWLQQPNRATFLSRNFSMYQSKIISDYMQAMVPIGYNNFRNMFWEWWTYISITHRLKKSQIRHTIENIANYYFLFDK